MLAVAFAGVRDLVPLYAVYALLFSAEGVSEAGISVLFGLWSVTAFVAEVPSGALADVVSRRGLLISASLLTAGGFACWLVVPTPVGFAAGFVAWGIGGALASGTWESLVHDALVDRGAADRYAGVIGLSDSAGWVAAVAAGALSAPLLAVGGYPLVGCVSVAVMVLHAGMALALPDPPRTGIDPDEDVPAVRGAVRDYVASLRAGVREATVHPPVRRAVIALATLTGLTAFDEYLPLVVAESGAALTSVPLAMALVFGVQAVASALAGPAERLAPAWTPRLLAAGGLLLGIGAVSGHPWGIVVVAVGYGLLTVTAVVADARLQATITGRARATITSTVGVGGELVGIAVFVGYAGGSAVQPIGALVAVNAVPLMALAWWLGRVVRPRPRGARPPTRGAGQVDTPDG